ncbi:carbohydrate sulfotransferase 1-like [Argopecten irradians]|uniref:carbohydrate sulfotransferase 1-like n=1 Tax=Argopecten irradians TaxID=31199 RepID=UPI00371B6544
MIWNGHLMIRNLTVFTMTNQKLTRQAKYKSSEVSKILILTYMRSGSSFVAESLQQGYNHTFYSFEPFWEIYKKGYITPDKMCYRTNRCSMIGDALQLPETAISILKDLYECKLDSLPEEVLHTFTKFEQLADHRRLEKCFPIPKKRKKANIKQKTVERTAKTRAKCIEYLENKCLTSKQRVVKSIRISLQLAKGILEKIKDLKIIHLIRDPRAILQSRKDIGEINKDGFIPFSKQLCNRISRDIKESAEILDSYPGRVFPLRYECLTERPAEVLRKIYKDLSLPFISRTEAWVNAYTQGNVISTKGDEGENNHTTEKETLSETGTMDLLGTRPSKVNKEVAPKDQDSIRTGYNVFKANSSEVARGWRLKMAYSEVTLVDKLCSSVFNKIGAYQFKSQSDLEDLSHSDRYDTEYTSRYCT